MFLLLRLWVVVRFKVQIITKRELSNEANDIINYVVNNVIN